MVFVVEQVFRYVQLNTSVHACLQFAVHIYIRPRGITKLKYALRDIVRMVGQGNGVSVAGYIEAMGVTGYLKTVVVLGDVKTMAVFGNIKAMGMRWHVKCMSVPRHIDLMRMAHVMNVF